MSWENTDDCNDHGNCVDSKCDWDHGWLGDKWNDNIRDEMPGVWTAYVIVFGIIFYGFFLITLRKLYFFLQSDS